MFVQFENINVNSIGTNSGLFSKYGYAFYHGIAFPMLTIFFWGVVSDTPCLLITIIYVFNTMSHSNFFSVNKM